MGYSVKLELSLVSSLYDFQLVRVGFIRRLFFFFPRMCFLWSALPLFDICLSLCVRTRARWSAFGFHSHLFFFSVCVSVCLGDFLCVGVRGVKFTGSSFPLFCICIHMSM